MSYKQPATARSRQRSTSVRLATILLSHVLFAAGESQSFAQAQLDADVYFQHRGLDVAQNPIDRLISRFGFSCSTKWRLPNDSCRVEREVAAFVNGLPHNRKEITEALAALGATCADNAEKPIDCIYRKRVRSSGWITGEVTPRWSRDVIFVFHITAAQEEPFKAYVELTRTEEEPDASANCRTGACR